MEEDEFTHIENLGNKDLLKMKGRCILIDPDRRYSP